MALGSLAVTKNDGHYRGDPNWFMKYVATGSLGGVWVAWAGQLWCPSKGAGLGEMRSSFCTPTFSQYVLRQAP